MKVGYKGQFRKMRSSPQRGRVANFHENRSTLSFTARPSQTLQASVGDESIFQNYYTLVQSLIDREVLEALKRLVFKRSPVSHIEYLTTGHV